MAISSDYSSPVMVNGYSCRNCSDVAKAEHGIDPSGKKPASASDAKDGAAANGTTHQPRFDQFKVDAIAQGAGAGSASPGTARIGGAVDLVA